jgi:hypothetical protein
MPTQTTRSTKAPTPRTVLMRLTRGASSHVSWLLRSSANAPTVTVGSDPSCDWQVRAPGVPGHALSVALFDGGLFVASGPEAEVVIEGERLPEVWKRVEHPVEVALGAAQVEIAWELPPEELSMSSERERPTFPDAWPGDPGERARGQGARSSWVDRFSRPSFFDSPSVLGRAAQSRKSTQLLRYAGLVLFTALVYRAWLLLLDRI